MPRKQVSNEHAVRVVASLVKELDDALPDVGWGKSQMTCTKEALDLLGLKETDIDA